MNDFVWTQSNMEGAITELQAKRTEMSDTMENVKSELRDKLLQTGMSGAVADTLLETFQREVVAPAEEYLETAMNYITENTRVNETLSETTQSNTNIASM